MKHRFLPFLSILSLIACCIEVDISVPCFPNMARYFDAPASLIQLTVAVNFLGFFLASLVYGPLSDAFGRRKIMVVGNGLMFVGALGCVLSPTIPLLLVARFIQGLGASTSAVVVFAMIADVYKGQQALGLIGIMNSSLTIFTACAPIVGSFLNQAVGWRGSYATVAFVCFLSFVCLVLMLQETREERDLFSVGQIKKNYKTLLSSMKFFSASMIPSLLCASYMAFIASASFLYMETYKLDIMNYAVHQGLIVGVFSAVSLFAGKIVELLGLNRSTVWGVILSVVSTGIFWGWSLVTEPSYYLVTATMIVFAVGAAVVFANVFSQSMEIFPNLKGTSASAIMGMRAFLCFVDVALMGSVYNGDPLRVATIVFFTNVLMLVFVLIFLKKEQSIF